jgi:uncharacterized spore protein YtfJ
MSVLDRMKDAFSGRAVFGEVYERDGLAVLPVASVRAGSAGRGGQEGPAGVDARPAGAFVIKGDDVRWMPAFDLNRAILVGQVVGIVFLLTLRSIVRMRTRGRPR